MYSYLSSSSLALPSLSPPSLSTKFHAYFSLLYPPLDFVHRIGSKIHILPCCRKFLFCFEDLIFWNDCFLIFIFHYSLLLIFLRSLFHALLSIWDWRPPPLHKNLTVLSFSDATAGKHFHEHSKDNRKWKKFLIGLYWGQAPLCSFYALWLLEGGTEAVKHMTGTGDPG